MEENFVDQIRAELKGRKTMRPDTKKTINFTKSFDENEAPTKILRQSTPHPKKRQLLITSSDSSSPEDQVNEEPKKKPRQSTPHPKKHLKKQSLTPSQSELGKSPITTNGGEHVQKELNFSESEDDCDDLDFNFNSFFQTRSEQSFNDSFSGAHTSLDDNFFENSLISNGTVTVVTRCVKESDSEHYLALKNTNSTYKPSKSAKCRSDRAKIAPINNNQESLNHTETETDISAAIPQANYYNLPNSKLVVIPVKNTISIHGLFTFKVLHGNLELFGYKLDKSSKEHDFFSPRGCALLSLKNASNPSKSTDLIVNLAPQLQQFPSLKGIKIPRSSLVVLCKRLEDPKITFLEKHISQQIFPYDLNIEEPQAIFEPKGEWNVVDVGEDWQGIIKGVTTGTKLLISGGKGVGKSTFLRYSINRLLERFPKIRVLDLDPGQAEFTIPGCISVITISEPLFGPSYTHLTTANRSILSNINAGHDPGKYLEAVQSLMHYLDQLDSTPTLINSMGFTTGVGLSITSAAINLIQPTDILQICSDNRKKNFKSALSVEVVKENCKLFLPDFADVSFSLHQVASRSDNNNNAWTLEPRQVREMSVLAYFGQLMDSANQSLANSNLLMHEINLSMIEITDLNGEKISPTAAVANLVALCSTENNTNKIFRCHGWGIVRGVDVSSDRLVLITPEIPAVLEEVYYLVVSNVTLPPSVYMTTDGVTGKIPYVMDGELISLGQLTKRSYLPANKK